MLIGHPVENAGFFIDKLEVAFLGAEQYKGFYSFNGLRQDLHQQLVAHSRQAGIVVDDGLNGCIIHFHKGGVFHGLVGEAGRFLMNDAVERGEELLFPAKAYGNVLTILLFMVGPDEALADEGKLLRNGAFLYVNIAGAEGPGFRQCVELGDVLG